MNGALAGSERLADMLRETERTIGLRRDVMSSLHDVDGGIDAGQWGLVRHGCRDLARHATLLALAARGIRTPTHARREREWLMGVEALEVVDRSLADEAWSLLLDGATDERSTRALCERTFDFVARCGGFTSGLTRGTSLTEWSEHASEFRATCRRLGVPITDDWYFAVGDEDWPDAVRRWIDHEAAAKDVRGDPPTA